MFAQLGDTNTFILSSFLLCVCVCLAQPKRSRVVIFSKGWARMAAALESLKMPLEERGSHSLGAQVMWGCGTAPK